MAGKIQLSIQAIVATYVKGSWSSHDHELHVAMLRTHVAMLRHLQSHSKVVQRYINSLSN